MKTMKIPIRFIIFLVGLSLFSCEKEPSTEDFSGFSLRDAQETFFRHWNMDSLERVYNIGVSAEYYVQAPVKIVRNRDELFSLLEDVDTSGISAIERFIFEKLPQSIHVDFAKQSIVYFGLVGCICNKTMANVHQDGDFYSIRIISYLPDEWATNWVVDTMACSAIFPKIPIGATFAIETIEIEGGTQEAKEFMSNERWFEIKN